MYKLYQPSFSACFLDCHKHSMQLCKNNISGK